jgi:hypothetical protein
MLYYMYVLYMTAPSTSSSSSSASCSCIRTRTHPQHAYYDDDALKSFNVLREQSDNLGWSGVEPASKLLRYAHCILH